MLNNKKSGDAVDDGLTVRQRLRQERELEEKRKFGLAPLAVDAVSGKEISPNVPQFISQAPWYYGATGATLDHQRQKDTKAKDELRDERDRTTVIGQAKTFVAGACANCGSRTHKTRECYKPRRRVGAVHSGKVTGVDLAVERAEKNYAQKRDRFATGAGVDLMQEAHREEEEEEDDEYEKKEKADAEGPSKRPRLGEAFAPRTAVTGGSAAIKELPKYLHNLDGDGSFFDPKTGSMRGNPNAADPTRAFQGDLQRYRSGDYYVYLDMQHRFLKGESTSIVDFKLDAELQRERQQAQKQAEGTTTTTSGDGGSVEETAHNRLVQSLYGTTTSIAGEGPSSNIRAALEAVVPVEDSPTAVARARWAGATRNGHLCVFGSYFDRATFSWGYKCCRQLGKDTPACQTVAMK